jgi:hypothetical protein
MARHFERCLVKYGGSGTCDQPRRHDMAAAVDRGREADRALSAVNLVGQGFAVTRQALLEVEMDG